MSSAVPRAYNEGLFVDGRTDVRTYGRTNGRTNEQTFETGFIRSTLSKSRPKNAS